jgi:hypothetical protein
MNELYNELFSACKKTLSLIKKASFLRLEKTEKTESRWWRDDQF